jgi:hypothetical protein
MSWRHSANADTTILHSSPDYGKQDGIRTGRGKYEWSTALHKISPSPLPLNKQFHRVVLWHRPTENAPVRTAGLWFMQYVSEENDTQISFYDTVSTAQLILS